MCGPPGGKSHLAAATLAQRQAGMPRRVERQSLREIRIRRLIWR
jgi:hypothetical protein